MTARDDWKAGAGRPVMFITDHETRQDAEQLLAALNAISGPLWMSDEGLLVERTCPGCGYRSWQLGMVTPSDVRELPDLEEAVAIFAARHNGQLRSTNVLFDADDADERPWRGYGHGHGSNRAQRRRAQRGRRRR